MSKVKQAAEANKLKTASKQNKASTKKPLRFIIVGISNTVLDFVLMNIMRLVGLNLIAANTISTGTAMVRAISELKNGPSAMPVKTTYRQVVLFFIFTIIGIWVIQNGFIWLINTYIPHFGLSDTIFANAAKLIASVPSLIWNYLTYNFIVFREPKSESSQKQNQSQATLTLMNNLRFCLNE